MASTEYNVQMILRRCPKESPETIIGILNEIQTICYSQDCRQAEYIDPSTGTIPYIATVAGTLVYDCPANCRRTAAILTMNPKRGYSRTRPSGVLSEYLFRNKEYYKVPAESRDATPGSVAKVYFEDDPGDTTETYLHLYYQKPEELSDISQHLLFPDEIHYMLRKGVIAFLTADEYGNSGYDEEMLEKIAKGMRKILNRGMNSNPGSTPVRDVDREYDECGYGYR